MKNDIKDMTSELEQQVLTTLNLLAMELKNGGNWMEMHQPYTDRIMEDVKSIYNKEDNMSNKKIIKDFLMQFRMPEPEFDLEKEVLREAEETKKIIGGDPMGNLSGTIDTIIKALMEANEKYKTN